MSWDPFQREVLVELGHALYLVRDGGMQTVADAASAPLVGAGADEVQPMLVRMARAAGLAPAQLLLLAPDVAGRAAGMDAAAKRAVWPRLRALRCAAR